MNRPQCPYRCGEYCNVDIGEPVDFPKESERYPYSVVLDKVFRNTTDLKESSRRTNVILCIQAIAIVILAIAVILN